MSRRSNIADQNERANQRDSPIETRKPIEEENITKKEFKRTENKKPIYTEIFSWAFLNKIRSMITLRKLLVITAILLIPMILFSFPYRKGVNKVGETIQETKNLMNDKKEDAYDTLKNTKSTFNTKIGQGKEFLKDKKDDAYGYMKDTKNSAFNKMRDAKEFVGEKLEDTKDYLNEKKDDAYDYMKDTKDSTYNKMGEKWEDAKDYLNEKKEDLQDTLEDAGYRANRFIKKKTGFNVARKLEDAKDYLNEKKEDLQETFEDAKDYLNEKKEDAKKLFTNKKEDVKEFVNDKNKKTNVQEKERLLKKRYDNFQKRSNLDQRDRNFNVPPLNIVPPI